MLQTHAVTLPDGRTLAYAEYGDPDGYPLIWCHGNPGSRRDAELLEPTLLRRAGVRALVPDRPGIGESTFKPRRSLHDWPTDIAAFTAALDIDRFALLGLSAGAPFALAVAGAMGHRITHTGIVSGFGVLDALPPKARGEAGGGFFALARRSEWLARGMVWLMRSGLGDAEQFTARMAAAMPLADKATLADPRTRQVLLADIQEALRQGTRGLAWDAVLVARPWGIDLRGINAPVTFWHGDADRNAPVRMAEHLHGLIPDSRLRVYPGEGHFSVIVRHCEEIVGELVTPAERSARG